MSLLPDAKLCWDCGHEYFCHEEREPMALFSSRLAALHIHDNSLTCDEHLIPFSAKIDFKKVAEQLARSRYDGTLMLEVMYRPNEENSTEPTYKDFAIKAKLAAERLIHMVNQYRTV
jgi:sugar phosphate isomerase/epimerase